MQISIVNGSIEFDGNQILSEINFDIHDKEKIALVGRNGCGKTSLIRAICGEVELVPGVGEQNFGFYVTGNPTIGYLNQVAFADNNTTLYEEVLKSYKDVLDVECKLDKALLDMEKNPTDENIKRYSDLNEKYEILGGYTYKSECVTAINKFGFSKEEREKPLSNFSGGQRTKIAILKLLLSKPDILLLDEPTNHLDLGGIEWLETYLKNYPKAFVIISHDRMFMDRSVNTVYEIEYGETYKYKGNYSDFVRQKKEKYEQELKNSQLKKREYERLSKIIEKFRYKASKAAMAQAKIKQLERMGPIDGPRDANNTSFRFNLQPEIESVNKVLSVENLKFGYSNSLGEISFELKRGDRLGIIGNNGCGKSTLVKTLMDLVPKIDGEFYFGLHSEIGYFDQTATQSNATCTVLEDFLSMYPRTDNTRARTILGAFMFYGEDVFKRVCDLSGGEKVRLALCKLFNSRPNVLILDEPTNHMDLIGKETIEEILSKYTGTIIIVSHDRYLINNLCNKIISFDGGVKFYPLNYQEYSELKKLEEHPAEEIVEVKKDNKQVTTKDSWKNSKERIAKKIEKQEEKISVLEKEIQELENKLNNPEIQSDYIALEKIDAEKQEKESQLLTLLEELEVLNKQL